MEPAKKTATRGRPPSITRERIVDAGIEGALEYVLYGTGADDALKQKNSFRCRYGAAIAGNIANIGVADLPAFVYQFLPIGIKQP